MGSRSDSWSYVKGGDPTVKKTTKEKSAAQNKVATERNDKVRKFRQAEGGASTGSNLKSRTTLLSGQYS